MKTNLGRKKLKKVLVNVIAERVDYTQFYPEDKCPGDVINKLLKRYVRMRAYIATKHIQDIYQEKKKKRKETNKRIKPSSALRQFLKNASY